MYRGSFAVSSWVQENVTIDKNKMTLLCLHPRTQMTCGSDEVVSLARHFTITEFMVNCGKLGEEDMQKLRDIVDDKLNRSNQ